MITKETINDFVPPSSGAFVMLSIERSLQKSKLELRVGNKSQVLVGLNPSFPVEDNTFYDIAFQKPSKRSVIVVFSSPIIISDPDSPSKVLFNLKEEAVSINVILSDGTETRILGMRPARLFDSTSIFGVTSQTTRITVSRKILIAGWILLGFGILFTAAALILMVTIKRFRSSKSSSSIELPKKPPIGVWKPAQATGTVGLFILNKEKGQIKRTQHDTQKAAKQPDIDDEDVVFDIVEPPEEPEDEGKVEAKVEPPIANK
jgi:hypothetical protein